MGKEQHKRAQSPDIGAIADHAPLSPGSQQASAGQYPEMGGKRVGRNIQLAGNIPCGEAFRFMPDEKTECLKPGLLRKGAQRLDSLERIHISGNIEM